MTAPVTLMRSTMCGRDHHDWCLSIRCECACHGHKASHAAGRSSGTGGSAPPASVQTDEELGGQRGEASASPPAIDDEATGAMPALAPAAPRSVEEERVPDPATTETPPRNWFACPECGSERGSKQALGAHRHRAHGVAGESAKPNGHKPAAAAKKVVVAESAPLPAPTLTGSSFVALTVLSDGRRLLQCDDGELWVASVAQIT